MVTQPIKIYFETKITRTWVPLVKASVIRNSLLKVLKVTCKDGNQKHGQQGTQNLYPGQMELLFYHAQKTWASSHLTTVSQRA